MEKSRTTLSYRHDADAIYAKVGGSIDERSDFGPLTSILEKGRVAGTTQIIFDLGTVIQINSIGVKKWVGFFSSLHPELKVRFAIISEMIVAQANVISSMLGPPGTLVEKFVAPYFCSGCLKEFSRTLKQSDLKPGPEGKFVVPGFKCEECGGNLVFDEYEEEYFYFLRRTK